MLQRWKKSLSSSVARVRFSEQALRGLRFFFHKCEMRTNNHSNNAVMRLPLKVGSGCFRCCAFRYSVYPNSDIRNVQIGLLTDCNTQAITESANMLLLVIEIFCLLSLSIDTDTFRRTTDANILKLLGANRPLLQVGFFFFFWLNLSSLLAYQTGAYPSFLLREAISSKRNWCYPMAGFFSHVPLPQ